MRKQKFEFWLDVDGESLIQVTTRDELESFIQLCRSFGKSIQIKASIRIK